VHANKTDAAVPPFTAWARPVKGYGGWRLVGYCWTAEGCKALGRMLAPGQHIQITRGGPPAEYVSESAEHLD
jgi:hypothetical protein